VNAERLTHQARREARDAVLTDSGGTAGGHEGVHETLVRRQPLGALRGPERPAHLSRDREAGEAARPRLPDALIKEVGHLMEGEFPVRQEAQGAAVARSAHIHPGRGQCAGHLCDGRLVGQINTPLAARDRLPEGGGDGRELLAGPVVKETGVRSYLTARYTDLSRGGEKHIVHGAHPPLSDPFDA
jgi:hypothetical protein